jgi:hypothetical protein
MGCPLVVRSLGRVPGGSAPDTSARLLREFARRVCQRNPMADFTPPGVRRPNACQREALRRSAVEAAIAVTYLIVGLVVLIVVLVIGNARRGGPATRTGGQADNGDGGGDGGGGS